MTVISAALFGVGGTLVEPGRPPGPDARPRPLAGAVDLLRECAARGWTVVLTAPAAGLDGLPALTVTRPAPDPVRSALGLVGAEAAHAVCVAGGIREVLAARQAGVPCVAVESGGVAGPLLRAAGATEVHRDAPALLRVLDDSLLARPRAFGPATPRSGPVERSGSFAGG
ncbi:HAD family hydrolase [Kitasatospora sp. NPDC004240]